MAKVRHKTVLRFFRIYALAKERNRRLTYKEVMQELHCSRSCAYNYLSEINILLA
jgi:hypothetical protein